MTSRTPHEHNIEMIRSTVPAMRYAGGDFALWQEGAREKLADLLGLPFETCDLAINIEYEREFDDFTETRFTFQSEPGYTVPCHFLRPRGADKPLPVVICLQGHTTGMHISLGRARYPRDEESIKGGDRDFGIRAIKEGYCALVLEQRCFGERGGSENSTGCFHSSMAALLIGRTTTGERVWDISRAIDALVAAFPQANPNKIICMGNSSGGTTTFFAACLEKRIAYAMPSCYFCTFDDSIASIHHCSCNFVPNIRKYFDMGDMAGMIAPRPLVIVAGKDDPIFPNHAVNTAFEMAKSQYSAANSPGNIALVTGQAGHRFYADDAWPVMNAFVNAG